jgi:hypothetical protein
MRADMLGGDLGRALGVRLGGIGQARRQRAGEEYGLQLCMMPRILEFARTLRTRGEEGNGARTTMPALAPIWLTRLTRYKVCRAAFTRQVIEIAE